jgi:thiamine pyrophosphate-dependent acetolactate synthase large subunit-like protein
MTHMHGGAAVVEALRAAGLMHAFGLLGAALRHAGAPQPTTA